MTAALHLAHAHQPVPPKRKRKRGGGGNGNAFANMAHRIYQDDRADPGTRSLLLAVAWATTMAPLDDDTSVWHAARNALDPKPSRATRHTLASRVRDDVPRYEPPRRWVDEPLANTCVGPRLRPHPAGPDDRRNQLKICGAPAQEYALEKLPGTGWHKRHWFCPRHRADMLRVRQQVAAQNAAAPEPVPNRGGLLPVYFESDWLLVYRWALGRAAWEPPVYGICADDWPVPGREPVPPRARLRLAALDGELTGDDR